MASRAPVADIAAGLSLDTRELFLQCLPCWFRAVNVKWSRSHGATGHALMALAKRGLLEWAIDGRRCKYRLTPLGLAVRAHLTKEKNDGK